MRFGCVGLGWVELRCVGLSWVVSVGWFGVVGLVRKVGLGCIGLGWIWIGWL